MVSTVTLFPELNPHTRILEASATDLIAALCYFDFIRPGAHLDGSALADGRMASLGAPEGKAAFVSAGASSLQAQTPRQSCLVVFRRPTVPGDPADVCNPEATDVLLTDAAEPLEVRTEGRLDIFLIQFHEPIPTLDGKRHPALRQARDAHIACLVNAYLSQSLLHGSHQQAVQETNKLILAVRKAVIQTQAPPVNLPSRLDRRLERILQALWEQSERPFDLAGLARFANTSQRNLYNLMRQHTRLTPYRLHQRLRLLKVREAFLREVEPGRTVSWHAMNQGFTHMGRFASLYRWHFGELPSETLAWSKRLKSQLDTSQPAPLAEPDAPG